jgi:hypothetical protein
MNQSRMKPDEMHLVLHALAIKKYALPVAVGELSGLDEATVTKHLAAGVERGRVVRVKDGYALAPLARMSLESDYSRIYAGLQGDARFTRAYERFESINRELKTLMTDWQTLTVAGEQIANDHSDAAYDYRIIDRLGALHERVEPVLGEFVATVPRLAVYGRKLDAALERSEDGALEWVSSVKIDSYHTVWFELHEDLLRMLDRKRDEA